LRTLRSTAKPDAYVYTVDDNAYQGCNLFEFNGSYDPTWRAAVENFLGGPVPHWATTNTPVRAVWVTTATTSKDSGDDRQQGGELPRLRSRFGLAGHRPQQQPQDHQRSPPIVRRTLAAQRKRLLSRIWSMPARKTSSHTAITPGSPTDRTTRPQTAPRSLVTCSTKQWPTRSAWATTTPKSV
jgi:hypothetical protein